MKPGQALSAVITVATDNQNSAEVDLLREFEYLQIIIPTITAAIVQVKVATATAGTFNILNHFTPNATGHFTPGTTSGTGGLTAFVRLGGFRYIKIYTSATQAANRTFTVRGMDRMADTQL